MTPSDRESRSVDALQAVQYPEPDGGAGSLLFGDDDWDGGDDWDGASVPLSRADRRRERARRRRLSRRGWTFVLLVAAIVAAVVLVGGVFIADHIGSKPVTDYTGAGTGTVVVTVAPGDSASDIATTLVGDDVVKTAGAFTAAAAADPKSTQIQPGRYALRHHMSGAAALAALLNPAQRLASSQLAIPEGATVLDVRTAMERCYGTGAASRIDAALKAPQLVQLTTTYKIGAKFPSTPEGFLYPATYTCDPAEAPVDALTTMVSRYLQEDRSLQFADQAEHMRPKLTPYQALTVASIAQSEAKFPQDMPRVVRTILNRIAAGMPLKVDATSLYACKLAGTTTSKCIYASVNSRYNTYTHKGLPPTPISNPGDVALNAAVHPATGTWLYYVNVDSAGHLGFFTNAKSWAKAVAKCEQNHWGCG